MPVERRHDFKQALSTLQQLKEKEYNCCVCEPCLNSLWRILFSLRFPVPLLLPWYSMFVTTGPLPLGKGRKKSVALTGNGLPQCCNCRVLNLVSTCCVFFSSLSHCCCHDVPCGNDCTHSCPVEEIRVFQACFVDNPSQVVCFENHAEWRFCLALFCVSRLVGAVALGLRIGVRARCCFLVLALFRARAHFCGCSS